MNTLNLETAVAKAPQRPLSDLLKDLRQAGVQVWVDGDRLRYKAPKGALTPNLMGELRDRKTEILAFLNTVATETDSAPSITPVDRQQPLPLSFAQERFWSLGQLNPQSPGFNMPMAYRLTGSVDRQAIKRSLELIIERHEILRTTFPTLPGMTMPLQVIAETLSSESVLMRQSEGLNGVGRQRGAQQRMRDFHLRFSCQE